jgi:hypothetical protein
MEYLKQMLKSLARIKNLPPKVFLAVFIVSSVVAIGALRHNNLTMIKLRDVVYSADKADGDVNAALNNLRNYVYAHMNTDLNSGGNTIKPPIQLKYTYERLETKAQKEANNSGLYTAAENYCQAKIPASVSFSGRGRIGCVEDYIMSHGGRAAAAIPTALYQYDFVSPSWSPDLAGWSLVVAGLSLIGLISSFMIESLSRLK